MANSTCLVEGCGRIGRLARGWCGMHYQRWSRHGDPLWRPATPEDRFWAYVDKLGPDGDQSQTGENLGPCWLWTGDTNDKGYGWLKVDGRHVKAHRFAYELLIGPIPPGLEPDHQCHNRDKSCRGGPTCVHRRCVIPGHLELVTHAENVRRGEAGAWCAAKTHCPAGHGYTPDNTYVYRGKRNCMACNRIRKAARRARQQAS